ncbi:MAG: hypothetical protein ACFFDF_01720 [Candidatus Odinarchaeota archaeon]
MIKKGIGFNKFILIIFILLNFFLISTSFISFSNAQLSGEDYSFSSDLPFNEYCQIEGGKENASSIRIDLPESNWTISNIQINFTNISLGSETRVIEDTQTDLGLIWNKNINFRTFALSTQIEILGVTDLLGVYIYGRTYAANETIKFQIQGFNENDFTPDGIILRSIDLNISDTPDWYYQDFSSNPLHLPIGNYSLVMNGTSLLPSPDAKYYWQMNNLDPKIPLLHTSSFITSWAPGTVNSSFLCKLKVSNPNQLYFPSEVNMTAQLNGDNYEIIDGLTKGNGFLNLSNLTYFSEEIDLNIPILINQSLILNYNYNYSIILTNIFTETGDAYIRKLDNKWTLEPIIHRITSNYYVEFNFAKNWYNLTLDRKIGLTWENVTSETIININTSMIIIPNGTILDGAEWRITANSPNIPLSLNVPKIEFGPGQQIQFSVIAPIYPGNLTFRLVNPLGFLAQSDVKYVFKSIETENFVLNYTLSVHPHEGIYEAYVFWHNITAGGVITQEFTVNIPFTIPPIWIVIGIIIVIGGITGGIFSYRTIKKYRDRRIEEAEKLYNKCMDVLNLEYIIVSNKKSGLNVYQQKFGEKEIDAAMISGFLQAIHSFGIELIKIEDRSQTIKLEYKDSIIIMTEFVNLRLILIMKEPPSLNFLYSLEDLAYDIYKYYGESVDQFNGDIKPFKPIEKLLKHHLTTSLTYPMQIAKIDKLDKIRIGFSEKSLVNKAIYLMKKNNSDSFHLTTLLREQECSPKDIEAILNLVRKNVFQVIE